MCDPLAWRALYVCVAAFALSLSGCGARPAAQKGVPPNPPAPTPSVPTNVDSTASTTAPAAANPAKKPDAMSELPSGVQILTPTEGVDFSAYLRPLVANIHSSWFRMIPEAARAGKKGKTIIRFYVRRNGTVENLRIETSSGDDAMDEAARKAITDAAPYETLPPAYKGLLIELRFIFLYNLPVAAAKE